MIPVSRRSVNDDVDNRRRTLPIDRWVLLVLWNVLKPDTSRQRQGSDFHTQTYILSDALFRLFNCQQK